MKPLLASGELSPYSGNHEITCHVCNERGVLLCCDFCPYVFHPSCLHPPMTQRPKDYWVCPVCLQDITSQHTVDIKLRCEKQETAQYSADLSSLNIPLTPTSMHSYVPTRVSSSSSSSSRYFFLSPSLSKSQAVSLSQLNYQRHSPSQ